MLEVNEVKSDQKKISGLDLGVMFLSFIPGLYVGLRLSGMFGEDAPPLLRAILGFGGLLTPSILMLSLRKNQNWSNIRLSILLFLIISIVSLYLFSKPSSISKSNTSERLVPVSKQAIKLSTGMTYRAVIDLLGRSPDTVINDQIREELGEPLQGNTLITFEWQNDNADCQPVSVQFDSSSLRATGWNEGRVCINSSSSNKPAGKSCTKTSLCNIR